MRRSRILFLVTALAFLVSALVRPYRELTVPLTLVFAAWGAFVYWSEKPRS